LRARASPRPDGSFALELSCERFAQAVVVRAPGFRADDNWFHLAPGLPRTIQLRAEEPGRIPSGRALALNARGGVALELGPEPERA
jgi:beta-mannosidase